MAMQTPFRDVQLECQTRLRRSGRWLLCKHANRVDANLDDRQELDPTLALIIAYHRDGTLVTDEWAACQLILEQPNFGLIGGMLCRVMRDGTLCLVLPTVDHPVL